MSNCDRSRQGKEETRKGRETCVLTVCVTSSYPLTSHTPSLPRLASPRSQKRWVMVYCNRPSSPSASPPFRHVSIHPSTHSPIQPSITTPLPPKAVAHPCLSCPAACSRRGSPTPCGSPCAYLLPSLIPFLVPVTIPMHFPLIARDAGVVQTNWFLGSRSITSQFKGNSEREK